MRVHWTNTAIGHLLAVYEYLASNSPLYARRIVERLVRRSEQVAEFPLAGRMVPEFEARDIREVIEGPYRIIYRATAERIDVLAVVHGTQMLPPEL